MGCRLLFLMLVLLAGGPAAAHQPSNGYLRVEGSGDPLHASLELALRDLELMVGLDANGDGLITWGELEGRQAAIEAYVRSRLKFSQGGEHCPLGPIDLLVDEHADGAYAVLRFPVACPTAVGTVGLRYALFFDLDPLHRALVSQSGPGGGTTFVLSPAEPEVALGGPETGAVRFWPYLVLGFEHMALGFDHLLFLFILLLPLAARPEADARAEGRELLKIITAFTAAHGLSLVVATSGLVQLPPRVVEGAIALTIVLTALDNLRPWLPARRWQVVFGFGLIHGLGFATALGTLDLPLMPFAAAVLAFNLGIELAQILGALVFLAATAPLHTFPLFSRTLRPVGSFAALIVAGLWLLDRAFSLALAA